MLIPRPEHPKPQFYRGKWMNLNGEWDFAFDFSQSGLDRKFYEHGEYTHKIIVPFCPESKLSGVHYVDFIPSVWYKRQVNITPEQLEGRVLLHFGAVDFETVVFVNGADAGKHVGGYTSFSFDITEHLKTGENTIVVYAKDDLRSGKQPSGKQSGHYYSNGCMYTRTTGIWQTVWLEFVPKIYIKSFKVYPHTNESSVTLMIKLSEAVPKASVSVVVSFRGNKVGEVTALVDGNFVGLTINLAEKHLWDLGAPNLYDLKLTLNIDNMMDIVNSYFGLRSITIQDKVMYLNGRPVFQRLVLDQGFYPDGIYTAPSDEALIQDIKLSMELGFNGARLHEKTFEERFLYHADKMGYLVWGEFANWGFDISTMTNIQNFLPEWLSQVERDFNHPSIIGWCPFNETWDYQGKRQDNNLLALVYHVTKQLDPTRPVIDTSGNFHVVTDVYDVHDYEQDVEIFKERYLHLKKGEIFNHFNDRQQHKGEPYFVSEYGGARWASADSIDSWGYGSAPKTEDEFAVRYEGLTGTLLKSESVCAFCYTQLYDVEQEKNGLYTYDRKRKFSDMVYRRIKACNEQKAAIEKL